jgi:hypothetical protein
MNQTLAILIFVAAVAGLFPFKLADLRDVNVYVTCDGPLVRD